MKVYKLNRSEDGYAPLRMLGASGCLSSPVNPWEVPLVYETYKLLNFTNSCLYLYNPIDQYEGFLLFGEDILEVLHIDKEQNITTMTAV